MIKKKSGFVNNWIIIAALIIIALIGGLIYYMQGPDSVKSPDISVIDNKISENEVQKPESESVIIKLSTAKNEYNLNELVNVDILLALADKKTPGVDILLKYDPKFLELQKISGGALQTSGVVSNPKQILETSKSSFDTFPYLKANILDGSMFFSALAQPKKDVIGEANIASLVFKAIKRGNMKISLVFDKSLNQDTGVFYMGKDILDKVINAEVVVK